MRWWTCLVAASAVVGCTAQNPAFEGSAGAGEATGTEGTATTTTTGTMPMADSTSRASTSSDPAPGTSEGDTTGASPDLPPQASELCDFDLLAINEIGQLVALDPDAADARVLLDDPRLASWALATDPATGEVYVDERTSPGSVWRVDPFAPAIDDEPLVVDAPELDVMARATFHQGNLWLGTDDTHRFVWLPPTGGRVAGDVTVETFPRGGDLVFTEGACAVVSTLDGTLYRVCFDEPPAPPELLEVTMPTSAQYTGIAIDAQDRMWLSTADPIRMLVLVDRSSDPWQVTLTVEYGDVMLNDLAPLAHPPGC